MLRKGGQSDHSNVMDLGRDLRRHSTIGHNSSSSPRNESPTRPSLSMENLPASRTSGSAGPSPLAREFGSSGQHINGDRERNAEQAGLENQSRLQPPTNRQKRFSLMRFRHASDSQLSTSYAQAAPPPVPNFPPTPTIITTSPTTGTLNDHKMQKRKSKFHLLSRSPRTSQDSVASERGKFGLAGKGGISHGAQNSRSSRGSQGSAANLRTSNLSLEEPGRLSTQSLRGAPPINPDESNSSLALPVSRVSESSRSEASDQGIYAATTTTHTVSTTTTFFRLPRRKKDKGPLFPLPMKIPALDSTSPSSATPRMSTSGRTSQSPDRPSISVVEAPPPTAIRTQSGEGGDNPSLLPSPSHSALALSVSNSGPVMRRQDSTASVHSTRSTLSHGVTPRTRRRGRSSTLGSLSGITDDVSMDVPPIATSVRTSTSTSGRKSFGDIFNLSHRLRQNSEPPIPRNGSPGGMPGTPASATSKPNSFSLTREAPLVYPGRDEGETPAQYVERLEKAVSRRVIATILSKTGDEFCHTCLRRYMRSFTFFGDPIDMSIRKMLMEVELPKETQQIDRVLQSFADRYHECNPGIFSSPEQAYFIAFSILILHTDIFNKSNKHKMQRQDYIKNTSGEGVAEDILGCFYDNISYTPFIHVEDDEEGQRLLAHKPRKAIFKVPSSDQLRASSRDPVDPYNLILDNKLDTLRPTLKDVMDLEDTYNFLGTADRFNMARLHQSFSNSGILQVVSTRSRPDAFLTQATISNPNEAHPGVVEIRVAKVGLLWRKDPRKKKTRSPWQEWGAILTNSSLYFFRDINWIKSLITQLDYHSKQGITDNSCIFKPALPLQDFKPDTILSTDDAVALQDANYTRHKHSFQFIRHGKFEEVYLANSEIDKNDWLAHLNYAATFRSAGVRMRGHIGFNYEKERNNGIGRMDSSHSPRPVTTPTGEVSLQGRKIDHHLANDILVARRQVMMDRINEANEKLADTQKQLENQLRNARHLQVLAPIQGRSREQILLAAGRMSARVKWVRMDIWRTKCHKEILSLDLDEEARHMSKLQLRDIPKAGNAPPRTSNPSEAALSRYDSRTSEPVPSSPKSTRSARAPRPGTSGGEKNSVADSLSPTNSIISQRTPNLHPQGASDAPLVTADALNLVSDPTISITPSRRPSHALLHQASIVSAQSKGDQTSIHQTSSRLATPTPSIDSAEERLLRDTGLITSADATPVKLLDLVKSDEKERTPGPMSPTDNKPMSPTESRSKVRRSLHRTLRDSQHGPHHHRSRKGRDSASTIGLADELNASAEGEAPMLSRASGSFVVHGKKASVITFGSEWQSMSPEERLKLRRQAQTHDGGRMTEQEQAMTDDGNMDGEDGVDERYVDARTGSMRSTSTTTAKSGLSRRTSDAEDVRAAGAEGSGPRANGDHTSNADNDLGGGKDKEMAAVEWKDFEEKHRSEKGSLNRHTPTEQTVGA